MRIIGDKTSPAILPNRDQSVPPLPDQKTTPLQEIRDINDTAEVPTSETAEQQLSQRLTILKAEEERRAAEKAEQERFAQLKVEQEKEATRQAAIKLELEQREIRKAEEVRQAAEKAEQEKEAARQATIKQEQEQRELEMRQAAEKAEQERLAVLKADEERLVAARKAFSEKLRLKETPSAHHSGAIKPSLPSLSLSADGSEVSMSQVVAPAHSSKTQAPATIWSLYLAAKANDPTLGRTEARVSGSKADSDLLFSSLLPHLSSSAGVKQISQSLSDYGSSNANYDFTALNYNVTAQMMLLHVPTMYSLSAAAAALGGEKAGVAVARQNLIVKFTDSYFSLLKAQTDKQIALGEIHRLNQVLNQSQAFLKAGTGDIISVYEAQSRLDGAGADLTKSESSLRLAEQKLSSQVGKPVSEVVNYLPQQPVGPDPDNLDWWVATMEKEQPLILQAREGVTQTSEQRKAAKAEYLPILQATGGYDVNRGTAALPTAEVRQWFLGATLSLPLYSGGETSAKVRRAVASEEERRHLFDETMDQQRENVKQAFFNLRYNISLIKALEQRKASAEIQLAAVKKGRKIGTRNAIDVLNAEQTYSLALRDYTYSLYDNIIRVVQLKSAAGILVETDISALSVIEAPPPGSGIPMVLSRTFK
jgi:outer membrane protein